MARGSSCSIITKRTMATEMTVREALNAGIDEEMQSDEDVFGMGAKAPSSPLGQDRRGSSRHMGPLGLSASRQRHVVAQGYIGSGRKGRPPVVRWDDGEVELPCMGTLSARALQTARRQLTLPPLACSRKLVADTLPKRPIAALWALRGRSGTSARLTRTRTREEETGPVDCDPNQHVYAA